MFLVVPYWPVLDHQSLNMYAVCDPPILWLSVECRARLQDLIISENEPAFRAAFVGSCQPKQE